MIKSNIYQNLQDTFDTKKILVKLFFQALKVHESLTAIAIPQSSILPSYFWRMFLETWDGHQEWDADYIISYKQKHESLLICD